MKKHLVESLAVHVFTLHLKSCDHVKFNSIIYAASDEFQGPSQYHGHGLGYSVKWP